MVADKCRHQFPELGGQRVQRIGMYSVLCVLRGGKCVMNTDHFGRWLGKISRMFDCTPSGRLLMGLERKFKIHCFIVYIAFLNGWEFSEEVSLTDRICYSRNVLTYKNFLFIAQKVVFIVI